ncbi:MAG: rhomboid family intramembrane serine protease [bacterium]|nr:rhomboid family intramembrane serine protease [bacterium]
MFFPYKSDVYVDMAPYANLCFAGAMILVYTLSRLVAPETFDFMVLSRENAWRGFCFVYFVHPGFFHLFGNVVFLLVFGNAINCRLGHKRYIIAFFSLGIISSVFHLWVDGDPAIGASGAVSGLVGMFLFLFPRSTVRCLYIFGPFIERISAPAALVIVGWFLWDLLGFFFDDARIAYGAHLAGNVAGLIAGFLVAKFGWMTFWMDDQPLLDV